MLDGLDMLGLQAGMRIDRFDGVGEAVRVIREGRGHLEAAVFESWQPWPGIVPMLRYRFMGHSETGMLILDHQHTVVRAQWLIAVKMTLRHRGASQQVPQQRLWRGQKRTNGIHPSLERRLGNGK